MNVSVDLLHIMENKMTLEIQKILKTVNVSSSAEVNENVTMKLNKNSSCTITRADFVIERCTLKNLHVTKIPNNRY